MVISTADAHRMAACFTRSATRKIADKSIILPPEPVHDIARSDFFGSKMRNTVRRSWPRLRISPDIATTL